MDDQGETIAFLSRSDSYGVTEPVLRCETHAAIVFLAGAQAYKLKRAVNYPYLDYSTREQRKHMCEAELVVNRRTAPGLYLRVQPIVRNGDTLAFGSGNPADAVDWVVVMHRFEQEQLLERELQAGHISPQLLAALAGTIAQFHAAAERCFDFGGSAVIAQTIVDAMQMFRACQGKPFDSVLVERFGEMASASLARTAETLEQRKRSGFVRRCHGDLHLNNIVVLDNRPVPFDAIEFNDAFSNIDTFYDLAFLLMDFDRHEARWAANAVFNRYLELTADYGGVAALPLFLACRAAVRAHVAATAATKFAPGEAERRRGEAAVFLERAIGYFAPVHPVLLALGGISGSGKSSLARELAPLIGSAPGAVVLRSDIVRKRSFGVADTVRLPVSAYTEEVTAGVYAEIRRTAGLLLGCGHSVIVDAVHGTAPERAGIEAVAANTGAAFAGLWLEADSAVIEQRLARRSGDASDADVAVARKQASVIDRPADWNILDVSQRSPAACVEGAANQLNLARFPKH